MSNDRRTLFGYISHPLTIIALTIFLLCIARFFITHRLTYFFLIVNIALAAMPLLFWWLRARILFGTKRGKAMIWILSLLWLLFLPNCLYIVTDFYHLNNGVLVNLRGSEASYVMHYVRGSSLYLLDALMILLGTLFGLLAAGKCLCDFMRFVHAKLSTQLTYVAVTMVVLLSSIGIYIGRFSRFNSWDVFIAPHHIIFDLITVITDPTKAIHMLSVILIMIVFHVVALVFVKSLRIKL